MVYEVGDIVKLKKPHPCGSHEWEILRVGADFRLKCAGCGRQGVSDHKEVRTSMNKYELAVVLSAKLEDEERAAAMEKVTGYITRFGGTVTDIDEWGKKRLAYEIQKMKEGFYYFVHFESDSVCPNEVENHIRIMEPVIRYLCVRQDA